MAEKRPNIIQRLLRPAHVQFLLMELVVVFALGFGANALWGWRSSVSTAPVAEDEHAAEAAATLWTCSMHPQIKKNKPGKCPLCGMALIPLKIDDGKMTGMRQLVVSPASRALMNIQVTPVQYRYVEAEIRMVGKVDYDETRLKYITAWVPGRLDRLFVDYTGVQVNKGDHMVYIYSEQLYSAQQELIEAAKAKRSQAAQSTPSFFETGGIDLLESTREKLRLLGLTKGQIAEIEAKDKPSDNMLIYSPMSGIVVEKLKQEGDRVNTGERIYTVADLSQLWVQLDAYESDLAWLRYGQSVTFSTEAYPGKEFVGRIAFIDPVLDDRTRTARVRVNIANAEGKLKPDMFVRGLVRAQVATGGRVIDADLAGKWVSPMHPEIVKDEPGMCDICGMPLVRAESLGYVAAEAADQSKPLVIPVSAALVTGTRAIVYVEDPVAKVPTFEGREIVIGPRAGDFYLVRSGLEEGEMVVTNGNFKIDSALQIFAKPSMMTPEGGGGGGGHHHGGGGSKPKDGDAKSGNKVASMGIEVPTSVRRKFLQIGTTQANVTKALKKQDVESAREALATLGATVQSVDSALLDDHAKMVWKELRMLIVNDAIEGRAIMDAKDGARVLVSLTRNYQRLDVQFGLSHAQPPPQKLDAPEEFRKQLGGLWSAYLKTGDALASDDFDTAKEAIAELGQSLKRVDMQLLTDNTAHMTWMREMKNVSAIGNSLNKAEDIKIMREHFSSLSGVMQVLAMSFGFGPDQPVFLLHCPMAFDNSGAIWLQHNAETRNPYFGTTMLQCSDRNELIAGGDATKPAEKHDEPEQ
jgi:membrane fusion protein, copper/silver efflux system